MAKYEYGLIFEDQETDKKVTKILDELNEYIADEHTMVDVFDFDENQMEIYVNFNQYNCEDEFDIQDDISKMVTKMGYSIEWDKYPDVDEYSMCSYTYSAIVKF